jgi:hypothetical protein
MKSWNPIGYALTSGVAAALLCACAGSSMPRAADSAISDPRAVEHSKTFDYTGKEQTFIVPASVTRLTISAHGGSGGGQNEGGPSGLYPGFPGRVYAVVRVHPGDKLYVFVGGSGAHGGFNGGGAGGFATGLYNGLDGGGASDVRIGGDALKDRIIVAAGGGAVGESFTYGYAPGGDGGGLDGAPGGSISKDKDNGGGGGAGGTQQKGGAGGAGGQGSKRSENGQPGGNGKLGVGGAGGAGGPGMGSRNFGLPGGGGGGGYYGGGGGGGGGNAGYKYYFTAQGGGGGGGSSYIEPSAITSHTWTGWRATGDGLVVFSWS